MPAVKLFMVETEKYRPTREDVWLIGGNRLQLETSVQSHGRRCSQLQTEMLTDIICVHMTYYVSSSVRGHCLKERTPSVLSTPKAQVLVSNTTFSQ